MVNQALFDFAGEGNRSGSSGERPLGDPIRSPSGRRPIFVWKIVCFRMIYGTHDQPRYTPSDSPSSVGTSRGRRTSGVLMGIGADCVLPGEVYGQGTSFGGIGREAGRAKG